MDEWQELEVLAGELRASNEAWAQSADTLQQQLGSFAPVAEQIERQFAELGVYDAMRAIARRLLNDTARVHMARLNFGLTQSAALIWSPMDDPRPLLAGAAPESQYSIEVRVGPRYLLGISSEAAGDQRLAIVIAGEKQLIATLPTNADRFRAAMLRAFQAPLYNGPPRPERTGGEAAAAGNEGAEATQGTAEDVPDVPKEEPTAKAASDERELPSSSMQGAAGEPAAAASAEEAADSHAGGVHREPPDDDSVIELPGAASQEQ